MNKIFMVGTMLVVADGGIQYMLTSAFPMFHCAISVVVSAATLMTFGCFYVPLKRSADAR